MLSWRSSAKKEKRKITDDVKCNDGSIHKTPNHIWVTLPMSNISASVAPIIPVNIFTGAVDVIVDAHQRKRTATSTPAAIAVRAWAAGMHIRKSFPDW